MLDGTFADAAGAPRPAGTATRGGSVAGAPGVGPGRENKDRRAAAVHRVPLHAAVSILLHGLLLQRVHDRLRRR